MNLSNDPLYIKIILVIISLLITYFFNMEKENRIGLKVVSNKTVYIMGSFFYFFIAVIVWYVIFIREFIK